MHSSQAPHAFFQNMEMSYFKIWIFKQSQKIVNFYTNFVTVLFKSQTLLKPALYIVVHMFKTSSKKNPLKLSSYLMV